MVSTGQFSLTLFRFIMAWPLCVEGIFSIAFFKQTFLKLAIFKTYRHGQFQFFLGKNPRKSKADQTLPLWLDREWFLPWIILGKTSHDLFWSLWAKEGQGSPQKTTIFPQRFFAVAGLSGSFICLETWDRGAGLRVQLGEGEAVFFKGQNYSGFIWFIDLNEQLSLCIVSILYRYCSWGCKSTFFCLNTWISFVKMAQVILLLFHDLPDFAGPTAC